MIEESLKWSTIHSIFPFLRYLPFVPRVRSREMTRIAESIVQRRREGSEQKDLLQIFLSANKENPEKFTENNILEEMSLFMYVSIPLSGIANRSGLLGVTRRPLQQHFLCFS